MRAATPAIRRADMRARPWLLRPASALLAGVLGLSVTACGGGNMPSRGKGASLEEARVFLDRAEREVLNLSIESQRADWVKSTFITDDTAILAARANQRSIPSTI